MQEVVIKGTKTEEAEIQIRPVEADGIDRRFVWVYFLLGYFFVYTFTSDEFFGRNFALFAAAYVAGVLGYYLVKGRKLARENWFWTAVVLAVGLPYGFWSVMPSLQVLMFIAAAAYWTLGLSGMLLDSGKTSQWAAFDMWNAMAVVPFGNFVCHIKILFGFDESREQQREKKKGRGIFYVALGVGISLPVLVIIIPLLSNADAGFQNLMQNSGLYLQEHFFLTFARILVSLPVTAYLFGLAYGGIHRRNTDRINKERILQTGEHIRVIPDIAMNTALIVVCGVYLLFIWLQGRYLFSAFAGVMPDGFTYAEYARRGFFELCQAAALNLMLLLGANLFSATGRKENAVLRWLNVLLSVLTLLLITTAVSKMGLYIAAYGLTVKRVLTMVFMVWMAIVFALVIVRQRKSFPLARICIFAGAVMFCLLCVLPVGEMIQAYNGWRFPG